MDYFSAPGGAPGIHDVSRPPFYIKELKSPLDWWEKLGMHRMGNLAPHEMIDQYPLLDNKFLKRVRGHEKREGREWHHFLYVSSGIVHLDEDTLTNDWDKAFNELIKHHYVEPAVGNAEFTYIRDRNFLPHMWYTKGPAFVHFTTALVTDPNSPYYEGDRIGDFVGSPLYGYERVSVRIIEFSKVRHAKAVEGIISGVFPSPYEQMLALTGSETEWQLHAPYSQLQQIFDRFYELCDEKMKQYPVYDKLYKAKDAMAKVVDPSVLDVPFMTGFLSFLLPLFAVSQAYHSVAESFWSFLHGGADPAVAARNEKLAVQGEVRDGFRGRGKNMMEDMLADYIDQLPEEAAQALKENPEVLDQAWNIVRGG